MTATNTVKPWPEVFLAPLDAPYFPEKNSKQRNAYAIADGIIGWELSHTESAPENFDTVMMKLATVAGFDIKYIESMQSLAVEFYSETSSLAHDIYASVEQKPVKKTGRMKVCFKGILGAALCVLGADYFMSGLTQLVSKPWIELFIGSCILLVGVGIWSSIWNDAEKPNEKSLKTKSDE